MTDSEDLALAMVGQELADALAERDRARSVAVRLEQENAQEETRAEHYLERWMRAMRRLDALGVTE